MINTPETIQNWIIKIEEEARNLTEWEENFVASVKDQFEKWHRISDRQEEILEEIYANKTP